MKKIAIINGPNLNLLGKREPGIYGSTDFETYFESLKALFPNVRLSYFQSNVEGELVTAIQQAGFDGDGIVINPAAYTHTSVAIGDAIAAIKMHLGLRGPAWPVRVYAGRVAFTHRNKAVPERHVAELGAAERASLDVAFAPYLDAMGYRRLTPSAP